MEYARLRQRPSKTVVAQAANDLKVSGFGQRTRAALRRNRAAGDKTLLPDHMFKDIPGPDLVRQLNALFFKQILGNPPDNHPRDVDRELLRALQDSLHLARQMVASIWAGTRSDAAMAFVDNDNIPVPFCPMYPDARDLVPNGATGLPHQLAKIIDRVRIEIERTPVWVCAAQCMSEVGSEEFQALRAAKDEFRTQISARQGETAAQWCERASDILATAKADVPAVLLSANRLVTTSVSAMISLGIWDYEIAHEDILECLPRALGDHYPDASTLGSRCSLN